MNDAKTPRIIAAAFTSAMSDWAATPMERDFWAVEVERALHELLRDAHTSGASGQTFEEWLG